ncbi:MAG TPA: secondary thiamine-phosphate synthase enzyme YjbQ [Desulfuromonadaceae bacterium]|jgi:secondary thiamine-phosphate synthase enzyme
MQTAELDITTQSRTQFIAITDTIVQLVAQHGWQDGVLTVFIPHTTAGVTINESVDPDVARDIENFSNELIPKSRHFKHVEGNSDAHLKASFFGSSVQVILQKGGLWLGTWQGIYFCEFDGPRQRKVYLAFSGG